MPAAFAVVQIRSNQSLNALLLGSCAFCGNPIRTTEGLSGSDGSRKVYGGLPHRLGRFDSVLLQQPIEAATVDAEGPRGASFVAAFATQDLDDMRPLDCRQGVGD